MVSILSDNCGVSCFRASVLLLLSLLLIRPPNTCTTLPGIQLATFPGLCSPQPHSQDTSTNWEQRLYLTPPGWEQRLYSTPPGWEQCLYSTPPSWEQRLYSTPPGWEQRLHSTPPSWEQRLYSTPPVSNVQQRIRQL